MSRVDPRLVEATQTLLAPDSTRSQRLRARADTATAVVQHLGEDYRQVMTLPDGTPPMPDLMREDVDRVRWALKAQGEDAMQAFGQWRNAVHELEALNTRRLFTLGWTARELSSLRDETTAPEVVDRIGATLAQWLHDEWRTDVDLSLGWAAMQAWAVRRTRRYDLLPKTWRYV